MNQKSKIQTALVGILFVAAIAFVFIGCPDSSSGESTEGDVTYFNVFFNIDGGTPAPAAKKVADGARVTQPPVVTKDGFDFAGWYKEAEFITLWNFGVDVVSSDMTLYAKWALEAPKATITFEANGGTPAPDPQRVMSGSKLIVPEPMIKTASVFDAWYTDQALTNKWNFQTAISWEEGITPPQITLYAGWKPAHTVTFNTNGGLPVPSDQYIENDMKLMAPVTPLKEGLVLAGWYTESTFGNRWNFAKDLVISDMTLYAYWVTDTENPNILFMWNYADNGWAWDTDGASKYLSPGKTGAVKHNNVTLSVAPYSGAPKIYEDSSRGGFKWGLQGTGDPNGAGTDRNNLPNLIIGGVGYYGTGSAATVSGTSSYDPWYDDSYGVPELDLSERAIKVTVGYVYQNADLPTRTVRMYINHSSLGSSSAGLLGANSQIGRWGQGALAGNVFVPAANDDEREIPGRLITYFNPNDELKFTGVSQTVMDTLKNAYICLAADTPNGAALNNYLIVSSIRVEYVDYIPPTNQWSDDEEEEENL